MTAPKISFYSFATYVIDIDDSKLFYKRLGYKQLDFGDTDDYSYVEMQPPGGDGVLVEIRQSYKYGENVGRTATVFTLDFDEGLAENAIWRAQDDIVEDLLFRGFNFIDMTPHEFYISGCGRSIAMVDPQGARIEFLFVD
jgi:hypothetical protein